MVTGIIESRSIQAVEMALDARMARQQAIASNIANVNTPGFKRVDLTDNFQDQFQNAMADIQSGKDPKFRPIPEVGASSNHGPIKKDGNNVSMEQEIVELSKNRLEYEFAAQVMASRFSSLKRAISTNGGGGR